MSIDYKAMYLSLFNDVSEAIEVLEPLLKQLKDAQRKTEEIYVNTSDEDTNLHFLHPKIK